MAKDTIKPAHSVASNIKYLLSIVWELDKSVFAAMLVTAAAGVLLPFYGIYLPKLVIGLIEEQAGAGAFVRTIGLLAAAAALLHFLERYCGTHRYWHTHKVRSDMMWRLFIKSLHCDYRNIESAEGQTKYHKSLSGMWNGDWSGINRMIAAMGGFVVGVFGFSLYAGLLSRVSVVIVALLILSSGVNYLFIRHAQRYAYARKDAKAALDKKVMYIQRKAGEPAAGKDVRLYAMKGWFLRLHDGLLGELFAADQRVEKRIMLSALVNAALVFLRDGLAYVYLILEIVNGRMAVSDFVFYSGAIAGFSNWITQMVKQAGDIGQASLQMCDIRDFFDMDDAQAPKAVRPIPARRPCAIEFRDVCFRYAGAEADALSHVNLSIKAGEKLAIVGPNGAGKTTLVKLLCGLYKPDAGSIMINGADISAVDKDELFDLFSVVFQDVFIAPFTVAENVALKTPERIDRDAVIKALDTAGLGAYIASVPGGIDALMTKIRADEGLILSGGQQQKLLLARALYKDAPILILDEPSAALDPLAESELYGQYNALTRGKTSVYISHRLASTRFCDNVVFISGGRVAEQGTHDELLARGGEYAKMFEIQSHYYKQDLPEREAAAL